jgi:hypothetical protein
MVIFVTITDSACIHQRHNYEHIVPYTQHVLETHNDAIHVNACARTRLYSQLQVNVTSVKPMHATPRGRAAA